MIFGEMLPFIRPSLTNPIILWFYCTFGELGNSKVFCKKKGLDWKMIFFFECGLEDDGLVNVTTRTGTLI